MSILILGMSHAPPMTKVAVLGLGAMGSRMAARLVAAGHAVTVYNRTPRALEGAESARTPAEAVADAEVVLSMVRDDAASRDVWLGEAGALAAMPPDAVAIEHSTLSLAGVVELASAFVDRAFVEAPVVGTRPHAEGGQLTVLAGGESAHLERVRPLLDVLAAKVVHLGPVGAGARAKLVVNAAFAAQAALWSELIGLLGRQGVATGEAVDLLAELLVTSPAAANVMRAVAAAKFAPMFPVELVAKDLGYACAMAKGAEAPLLRATRAAFQLAVDAGYGEENINAIAKLYV